MARRCINHPSWAQVPHEQTLETQRYEPPAATVALKTAAVIRKAFIVFIGDLCAVPRNLTSYFPEDWMAANLHANACR
jgi:hypothetical protein